MDDLEIVNLYWNRDPMAIEESDRQYGAYLYTVALQILDSSEDSEECLNDTWLRSWNAMPPNRPSRLRMFFAKIIRSLCFDRYRAQTARKRGGGETALVLSELAECIAGEETVEEEVLSRELVRVIRSFIRKLPERDGDLFLRRYFFSESVRQIAAAYQMKENQVSVRLSRIRGRLKETLEKEGLL